MTPETRLLIVRLLEEMADGIRKGTFKLDEREGQIFKDLLMQRLDDRPPIRICSIELACEYLDISQPTFRKYVREGKIPQGKKVRGFTELIWDKSDIESFKREYMSK